MVDEQRGREILKELFERSGYLVVEGFPFPLGSYRLVLDGYDPEARIGYEYITTGEGDREILHEAVVKELDRLNESGLLRLFLIDERAIPDEETLREAAEAFLKESRRNE